MQQEKKCPAGTYRFKPLQGLEYPISSLPEEPADQQYACVTMQKEPWLQLEVVSHYRLPSLSSSLEPTALAS
jgi:hypothetical protein